MKNSAHRAWRMIVSLSAFLVMGIGTAGFALADHSPVEVTPHIADEPVYQPGTHPNPPGVIPLPPRDDDPDPDPDAEPKPGPNPDEPVIVLKPGDDPSGVDAGGRFTGDATFDERALGDHKYVFIVAGRTLDERGNPVAGARVGFGIDVMGWMSEMGGVAQPELEGEFFFPFVEGFSDKHGDYRLRLTYYDEQDASRQAFIAAEREGHRPVHSETLSLNGEETRHDIELVRGAVVEGRCVDRYGQPVAGVSVSGFNHSYSGSAVTGEDGRFTIGGLGDGEHWIYIYSETHLFKGDEMIVGLVSGQTRPLGDIELVTRTSGVLRFDFPEEPAAKWLSGEISIVNGDDIVMTTWVSVTHEDGGYVARFGLEGLPAGAFNARVFLSGESCWEGEIWINPLKGELNDLGVVYLRKSDRPAPAPVRPAVIEPGPETIRPRG